jgi:hypothetical protein
MSASPLYAVTVEDAPVWTEADGDVHAAQFAIEGAATVRVSLTQPADTARVRPYSREIAARLEEDVVEFEIPGPGYYWLEVDTLPPLAVLADPPVESTPQGEYIVTFGPGEHDAGLIELRDGQTLVLEPGALVYGGIQGRPRNARVTGRGVLDARKLERPHKALELLEASDVEIDGITVRNSPCWTCAPIRSRGVTFRNLKILSQGRNGDGIDVVGSRKIRIENCFFRCTDDCIALKTHVDPRFLSLSKDLPLSGEIEDVRVKGCVMVGWKMSDGFTIGFETRGRFVRRIRVDDCDILYARGDNRVGGHSAFSIVCDGPTVVSDVIFSNLRAEEDVRKSFELHVTDGQYYVKDAPGHIENVTLRNCHWRVPRPFVLHGHDAEHLIRNVRFDRCTVAGEPLRTPRQGPFEVNSFVQGVKFT